MANRGSAGAVDLDAALDHLAADELVAFPTETVWGLAARACSAVALERLTRFKGRAGDQPISVLIDRVETLSNLEVERTPLLDALAGTFWPGPLTIIAPSPDNGYFAPGIRSATGGVGFRCSDHPVTAALVGRATASGLGPLTATSFNRSGETAVENVAEAALLAKSSADPVVLVLDPGDDDAFAQMPSTVVDLSQTTPVVLREGAIDGELIAAVLGQFREATPKR